jgi:SAM-dependent MidA family methyltransferase
VQKENLKRHDIKWYKDFTSFESKNKSKPILFVSNELFDCFAINQYVNIDGSWVEKLVGLNDKGDLHFVLDEKHAALSEKISLITQNLGKGGDVFEHSPSSDEFMTQLSISIKKRNGVAIIIDYGFDTNKFQNTLQALRHHKYSNIFNHIGQSDITSLVNFKRLSQIAQQEKLQTWLISQKEFLESLGAETRRKKLLENKSEKEGGLINSSIDRLISSDEMGQLFKVLIIS